jgi:hypothetical protein
VVGNKHRTEASHQPETVYGLDEPEIHCGGDTELVKLDLADRNLQNGD